MSVDSLARRLALLGGFVSTVNSTTDTLAASGGSDTFTGTAELNAQSDVFVSCKTDQDGTLYFDFSNDETNWDSFPPDGFEVKAGVHEAHRAFKGPRYFRTRLINTSASAQTYLRLYTYYGEFGLLNSQINSTIASDADAIVVRSVDSSLDLALGRFGGMTEDTKFGQVIGTDALDNPVDVWDFASDDLSTRSDTKTFPTSAATLYIASDASGDTSLDWTVDYIDSVGGAASVDVTTDASAGTTPVSLGVTGLDVNRIYLSGDTQSHSGNVYVTNANDFASGVPNDVTDVLAFVRAGYGQTQQAIYTVPAGKICRVKRVIITIARSSGAAGSASIHLEAKPSGGSWRVLREWNLQTGDFVKTVAGVVLQAGAQVKLHVEDVSDGDTNVTGEFVFDLVDA